MKLVVCPSEELRRYVLLPTHPPTHPPTYSPTHPRPTHRWYPGYENFLEDRIEPRFPTYTWEQLCALPFSLREQAHGELLHAMFSW